MSTIIEGKLDFYFSHGYNVMLRGHYGVGKTSLVRDCFERNGLELNKNYLYYSAATMDPWVDFIGIPREVEDNGNKFIDLVLPKNLANDNIIAIYLDEYNRSKSALRNAVMELIQFKSMNGRKFTNLKMVWTGINPEDDESIKYDVEELDYAQMDRFHAIIDIPYMPSKAFFMNRFSKNENLVEKLIEWWNLLPKEHKMLVSPRRLEYAIDIFLNGGNMHDVFNKKIDVAKFIEAAASDPIAMQLETLFSTSDRLGAIKLLKNQNIFDDAIKIIKDDKKYIKWFMPLIMVEKQIYSINKYEEIASFVLSKTHRSDFVQAIEQIANSGINGETTERAKNVFNEMKENNEVNKDEQFAPELRNVITSIKDESFINKIKP